MINFRCTGSHSRLVAETVLYAKGTTNALAIVNAEVASDEIRDITLSAPPGDAAARKVPEWQIDNFQRADMIKRMKAAGELLK
jgi:hypothetical protein